MVNDLKSISSQSSFDSASSYDNINYFKAHYSVKVYGVNNLKEKIKAMPGSTVLDHISMSDTAYCVYLVVNNYAKWEQYARDIKPLPKEEQAKFQVESKLPSFDREKYGLKESLYTSRKGRSNAYTSCGTAEEGVQLYTDIYDELKQLAADEAWYEGLCVSWDEFVGSRPDILGHHKKRVPSLEEMEEQEQDGVESVLPHDLFVLPGDKGCLEDCPHKKGNDSFPLDQEEEEGVAAAAKAKTLNPGQYNMREVDQACRRTCPAGQGYESELSEPIEDNRKVPASNVVTATKAKKSSKKKDDSDDSSSSDHDSSSDDDSDDDGLMKRGRKLYQGGRGGGGRGGGDDVGDSETDEDIRVKKRKARNLFAAESKARRLASSKKRKGGAGH